jgi:hypothetical protein
MLGTSRLPEAVTKSVLCSSVSILDRAVAETGSATLWSWIKKKGKAVPLHAMEALGGRGV